MGWAIVMVAYVALPARAVDLKHWFSPATQKVYPDSKAPEQAWPARICAALGEYEALQLVLRSDEDIGDLQVIVVPRGPRGEGSLGLSPGWVELFEVRYVPTPADRNHQRSPDPLVPLRAKNGTASFSLTAHETKAIWIRVHVPSDARPGAYQMVLLVGRPKPSKGTFTPEEAPLVQAPVQVTVWPFRLPTETHTRTAFGISGGYIAQQHGVKIGTPEYEELYRRYYDELLEHRVCAYSVPYGLRDVRALPYLRDVRVNSFTVPYSDDVQKMREDWEYLRSVGAAHKAWIYPLDEPVKKEQYEQLKERARKVHVAAPGLKVCSPFYRGPDWDEKLTPFDELVDYLGIWCCNTGYYSKPEIQHLMRQRQQKGEEAWWYVCCGPGHPFCNFFVNMAALQHRLLMWQMYRYGITGLLYWSTTHWGGTHDPYEDIATVKDINPNIYGDGSLFYPGSKVGISGPVSSVRLECIRDGLEDYEYLVLAQRVLGKEPVSAIVSEVAQDLVKYVTDPQKFETIRRRLGELLTGAKG